MNESIRVLAGFSNGQIGYKEYLEFIDSGMLSEELIKIMPLNVIGSLTNDKIDMLEQLCLMDKIRTWGNACELTANQFSIVKKIIFDRLRLKLIAAFSAVSLGDGITLAQANAIDCRKSEEEQAIARLKDINIPWKNYPKQDLENFTSMLHLDAKGFSYYIALYLTWCIDNFFINPYSNIASETFGAFDPELSGFSMRVNALNNAQKKLVKEFLWLFAVHSDLYRKTIVLGVQALKEQ